MKLFIVVSLTLLASFFLMGNSFSNPYKYNNNNIDKNKINPIYNISIKDINNKNIDLNQFKNKKILIVNTASKCGFTYQYKSLQKLHKKYKDQLIIIGSPSNDFLNQEPGNANEIKKFCELNYGVEFLLTEKIKVKGKNKHELFEYLTNSNMNGWNNSEPSWNFNKYLIDEEGYLINKFGSTFDLLSDMFINKIINN